MNIGNILKVADAIEQASVPNVGFNMTAWISEASPEMPDRSGRNCGTVACVAGWATIVALGRETDDSPWDVGQSFLELDAPTAGDLFLPNYDTEDKRHAMTSATPADAARVLRNLAITGKVDWEAAMKPADPAMPALPVAKLAREPAE
jgi:hypothetical protein